VTRRLGSAAAVLLLTATAACGSPSSGRDPSPAGSASSGALVSTTCADIVVLGVRGSNQAADRNRGVGREVLRTVTDLARLVGARTGASVRLEAVPYDATGTATTDSFVAHATDGARLAGRQADAVARRCPASRLALVGFSQGAQVVHTLASDVDESLASRIALVGMIADPQRNPSDPIRHWSYSSTPVPRAGLLGAGAPIDPDVRATAISFCQRDDEVCNARGRLGHRTSPTHRFFYEDPATARVTATRLDAVLAANGS
jgi:cutinase